MGMFKIFVISYLFFSFVTGLRVQVFVPDIDKITWNILTVIYK